MGWLIREGWLAAHQEKGRDDRKHAGCILGHSRIKSARQLPPYSDIFYIWTMAKGKKNEHQGNTQRKGEGSMYDK
ncbi:MAG: hypothetical protein D6730_01155, partial [Bacteroidetes bacterium]